MAVPRGRLLTFQILQPVTLRRAETSLRGTLYSHEDAISLAPAIGRLRLPGSENHDAQGIFGVQHRRRLQYGELYAARQVLAQDRLGMRPLQAGGYRAD